MVAAGWAQNVMTRGKVRRVARPPMVMRSFRVSAKLWASAKAKADEREENLADVLREALERYVRSRNGTNGT